MPNPIFFVVWWYVAYRIFKFRHERRRDQECEAVLPPPEPEILFGPCPSVEEPQDPAPSPEKMRVKTSRSYYATLNWKQKILTWLALFIFAAMVFFELVDTNPWRPVNMPWFLSSVVALAIFYFALFKLTQSVPIQKRD